MSDNLKDILSNLSTEIDQEKLLLYLQGKLPKEQHHEIERHLADNEFEDDAVDGLKEISDQQKIAHMVELLNRDLKKKVARKKLRREKLKLPDQTTLYVAIVIILILVVISFMVVHRMRGGG